MSALWGSLPSVTRPGLRSPWVQTGDPRLCWGRGGAVSKFPHLLPVQGSHSCFPRLVVPLPQPLSPTTYCHVGLEAVGL